MSSLEATDNEQFSTRDYWDRRYTDLKEGEDTFDWFKTYDDLKPIFDELIPSKEARILMLGCGNSTLSGDMYASGYERITNLDYSAPLIESMKRKHDARGQTRMKWLVMDVTQMTSDDNPAALCSTHEHDEEEKEGRGKGEGTWDVAIDKGTMDAFMAEKGSVWDPSPRVRALVKGEVDGVLRLLKPGGLFIYLTFGQPHFRRPLLERPDEWDIEVKTIGDMFHYYLYVCRKRSV
ncbi:uncharacterized protein PFL1_02875 [Pseudozyma flocculosa PF-1]|uniref:Methyltransferase domain-containing protein n=2 Tax=Pseudozyma flocculosa TaxID=84751 RepID=A0A061HC88_9BASI|nr:uncharacterized protein PFL1_02875 [Pseudozyma flocculosa PF-1]EPQ29655.1 hypothetical protein PFL1_02875 [Pseudozyma flocculosa PF-1]SPO38223.1 related to SEE1 - probable lysine methyltransferase [Pseudozyma flocculosa]